MESLVFEGVHYYIIEDNVINPVDVKQALKKGGASREFYISDLVTHIISDLPVKAETLPLKGQDHVIVNSDWALMSLKCGAQLPIPPFECPSGKLFSGLVFCPSKLCSSDVEKLCVIVLFHGGKIQRRLDSKVTYLVTMETTGAKYLCALKHPELKVVSPDWILDSIDANKRLEEEKYHPSRLKMVTESQMSETCNGLAISESAPPSSHLVDIDFPQKLENEVVTVSNEEVAVTGLDPKTHITFGKDSLPAIHEPVEQIELLPEETPQEVVVESEEILIPTSGLEKLLDGVVIYFTDYQDCVEKDTLDKWKLVVRQHGGKVLDVYDSNSCTHLLALHKKSPIFTQALGEGKCIASAHWLNDVLTEQKMFPPRNAIHFPTAFKWQFQGAENYFMTLTNYVDSERELVKDMLRVCGITYTGHLSRENTHLICKRPEGKKYEKALEWKIKVVNSAFLADIIHNGQLPAVLFHRYTTLNQPNEFSPESCFEASRILECWKPFLDKYCQVHSDLVDNSSSVIPMAVPSIRKRERSDNTSLQITPRKKRVSRKRPYITVLFTGISLSIVKKLKQIVLKLGGIITDNGKECTHIVTPRVARTVKFLSGISVCKYIVTPKWVEACGQCGSFIPEKDYFLSDPDAEQLFGMDVATSLSRAKEKKLLSGLCICPTPNIQPPFNCLKEIVSCAGGEVLTVAEVRSRFPEEVKDERLIILSTPDDIESGHCKEFFERNAKVYNAELILTGVLKQTLDYSQYTFVLNSS